MAPGGDGCRFKLKANAGSNIQVDLGIAMKTCPNSDLPFISVVLQGGASKLAFSSWLGWKETQLLVMTSADCDFPRICGQRLQALRRYSNMLCW